MAEDAGVIPLSRFRAQLARAKRGRRAEALLAEPNAAELVPRLSVPDLYYAIKEVGLADAEDLVALASPEQVRGFLDLDGWQRDVLDETRLEPWLEVLANLGPLKLARVVDRLDPELMPLYLSRTARVYDLKLEDDLPPEPAGRFYPTPDGFFLIDILPDGERGKLVERMIDHLYRADMTLARHVLMAARSELPAQLEEASYRWRTGRLADLGYLSYDEAIGVYAFLDPAKVRPEAPDAPPDVVATDGPIGLPVPLAAGIDTQSTLARALGLIDRADEIERLEAALVYLANRALAADRVEPSDLDAARDTLARAVGYLGMATELLTEGDLARAPALYARWPLERLFRLGYSLTLKLRRLAETLVERGVCGLHPGKVTLLDPPHADLVVALRRPRPLFPRRLDPNGAAGERPFASLADARRVTDAIEETALIGPFVLAALRVPPDELLGKLASITAPEEAVRFSTLVRTAAARQLLGGAPALAPLLPRELKALARRLADGAPDAAALARDLFARAPAPAPPFLLALAEGWIAALPERLPDADGVLQRFSWLT
jgi:hypothetical protein